MTRAGPLRIGQVLDGKYLIESLIGRGGMGSVYRARHVELDAPRAIKVVRADLAAHDHFLRRFRTEAVLAEGLRHSNLVSLYDFTSLPDGSSYMVWEYVEGETLASLLHRGTSFGADQVVQVIGQVADGLEAAHRRGIVHRDVSPENIMLRAVGGRWQVKVLDFGIAKMTETGGKTTGHGAFLGKIGYAPPEQTGLVGEIDSVDARTDVFSLAVVAYRMLVGQLPFRTRSASEYFQDVVVLDEEEIRERALGPLVEPWRTAIGRALYRDRGRRTPSMEALKSELERAFLAGPALLHPAPRALAEPTRGAGVAFSTSTIAPTAELARVRRPVSAVGMGAAALVCLAIALGVVLGRGRQQSRSAAAAAPNDTGIESNAVSAAGVPGPADPIEATSVSGAPRTELATAPSQREDQPEGDEVDLQSVPHRAETAIAGASVPAAHANGRLVLSSEPRASVAIDGALAGITPVSLEVAAGPHLVVFTTLDGERWEETVTLPPGDLVSMHRNLGAFGSLSVTSDVWAEVHLDGGSAEQTPIHYPRVRAGIHELRGVRSGYRDQVVQVVVETGKTSTVVLSLEKQR